MSHVYFMCEKLVESKDSARASCMAQSLLARLHSTGFDETEQEAVLECLGTVLELLDVMMPTQTLPFLESVRCAKTWRSEARCCRSVLH